MNHTFSLVLVFLCVTSPSVLGLVVRDNKIWSDDGTPLVILHSGPKEPVEPPSAKSERMVPTGPDPTTPLVVRDNIIWSNDGTPLVILHSGPKEPVEPPLAKSERMLPTGPNPSTPLVVRDNIIWSNDETPLVILHSGPKEPVEPPSAKPERVVPSGPDPETSPPNIPPIAHRVAHLVPIETEPIKSPISYWANRVVPSGPNQQESGNPLQSPPPPRIFNRRLMRFGSD